jgi:diguanylate cyclase (GGDEF)-like protein
LNPDDPSFCVLEVDIETSAVQGEVMPDTALPCSPVPDNEEQRLQSVLSYEILDSPPEADFDALVRLSTLVLASPAAVLGLMDTHRIWFKARTGITMPEIDRLVAMCSHTIVQPGEPLVIEDLRTDPRFARNPLVVGEPYLRFYAGTAVLDPQGLSLGTIAVFDTEPRTLLPAQRASLADLSVLASTALENRRRGQELVRLAMTDQLTGLSNRNLFERTLAVELSHSMRTGEAFTALLMDLDGFKDICDGFGRAAGDEVLCLVARRLSQQVRLGDLLARLGEDDFGVVMRHGATESAQVLARRIVKAVSAPITLSSGDTVGVGISVGMAAYTDKISSVAKLLEHADHALYQAKKQNEKRWKMFVGMR